MIVRYTPYDGNLEAIRTNQILRLTNSTTNQVSNGAAPASNTTLYPRPTTVSDYMLFDGNKCIRYLDGSPSADYWRTSDPYSVEMEVFLNSGSNKYIATNGEGFSQGYGEWSVIQNATDVVLTSSSDNNGNQFSQVLIPSYSTGRWYKISFMFYTSGSTYKCRGYLNSIKMFDIECQQPYNTANGVIFGGDCAWDSGLVGSQNRKWSGRLRNITVGRSKFWPNATYKYP